MMRTSGWTLAGLVSAVLAAGCGSSSNNSGNGGSSGTQGTGTGSGAGFTITIQNLAFSPLELAAPPGATVTVVNADGFPHTVTSETTPNAFIPGAVGGVQFDTGPFTGQTTFTLPANAAAGTVIPYFCNVHKSAMATPTGTIRIDPTAGGSGGTSGTSGSTGTSGTMGTSGTGMTGMGMPGSR